MFTQPSQIVEALAARQEGLHRALREGAFSPELASGLRHSVRLLGTSPVLLALGNDPDASRVVVDEKRMSVTLPVSTRCVDRMGDVVEPRGCLPHLKNYERNPRVFFSHRSTEHPIGSARDPDSGALALQVLDDEIISTCFFHGETPESEVVFRLVKRRELQAASIGFLPVVAALLKKKKKGDEEEPPKNEHGERVVKMDPFMPLRFTEWDLTEWSIVPVPANPEACEALTLHLERGHVEGEKIPLSVSRSLEGFKLKAKIWSPGFNPESSKFTGVLALGEREVEYTEGKLVRLDDHKFMDSQTTNDEGDKGPIGLLTPDTIFLPVVAEADGALARGLAEGAMTPTEVREVLPGIVSPVAALSEERLREVVEEAVRKTMSSLDDTLGGVLTGGGKKTESQDSPAPGVVESQEHARKEMELMQEILACVKDLAQATEKAHQEILRCLAPKQEPAGKAAAYEAILKTQKDLDARLAKVLGRKA